MLQVIWWKVILSICVAGHLVKGDCFNQLCRSFGERGLFQSKVPVFSWKLVVSIGFDFVAVKITCESTNLSLCRYALTSRSNMAPALRVFHAPCYLWRSDLLNLSCPVAKKILKSERILQGQGFEPPSSQAGVQRLYQSSPPEPIGTGIWTLNISIGSQLLQ